MRIPLLIVGACLAVSCAPEPTTIEIPFAVRYGATPLACDAAADALALTDLRFFVHNIRLLDAAGNEIVVTLTTDDRWQSNGVALLDFENGEGACENGSPPTNFVVRGQYTGQAAAGLRMDIGVPEPVNHADPLRASGPLTQTAMHWHWKSGYKFLRLGYVTPDGDGFWMHLGSSHCAGTIGDIRGCRAANRPRIDLADYVPGQSIVLVDLENIVATTDLTDRAVSECQSGPNESACAGPFAVLGVDFDTGESRATAAIFRIEPQ